MTERTCGRCCKGSAPWFICRIKSCTCHRVADLIAAGTPNQLAHKDPTANTAIGNLSNPRKRTP